jgi:hypothetical protein
MNGHENHLGPSHLSQLFLNVRFQALEKMHSEKVARSFKSRSCFTQTDLPMSDCEIPSVLRENALLEAATAANDEAIRDLHIRVQDLRSQIAVLSSPILAAVRAELAGRGAILRQTFCRALPGASGPPSREASA